MGICIIIINNPLCRITYNSHRILLRSGRDDQSPLRKYIKSSSIAILTIITFFWSVKNISSIYRLIVEYLKSIAGVFIIPLYVIAFILQNKPIIVLFIRYIMDNINLKKIHRKICYYMCKYHALQSYPKMYI